MTRKRFNAPLNMVVPASLKARLVREAERLATTPSAIVRELIVHKFAACDDEPASQEGAVA